MVPDMHAGFKAMITESITALDSELEAQNVNVVINTDPKSGAPRVRITVTCAEVGLAYAVHKYLKALQVLSCSDTGGITDMSAPMTEDAKSYDPSEKGWRRSPITGL